MTKLVDEQLENVLEELGVQEETAETEASSLDALVDEIMEATEIKPAPAPLPQPVAEPTRARSPLKWWVIAAFTCGLALGYLWGGKNAVMGELSVLKEHLERPSEVIEPLEEPSEMEKLAPAEIA